MQISVSSTLTVYHDGQFWVGIIERIEEGRLEVARITFGVEPSNEEILQFVIRNYEKLRFSSSSGIDVEVSESTLAKNPKRRQREAAKALKKPAVSTKAQQALAKQYEATKETSIQRRRQRRLEEKQTCFERRREKRKEKRRGH